MLLTALLILPAAAPNTFAADEQARHSANTLATRDDDLWWKERHEGFNHRAAMGNVDLVFIGDSITQSWENEGKTAWDKHYGQGKAMNLGISGDRTQHVLWRLEHGNVECIAPKVAVIMIGTNNSNASDNTAAQIADGIQAIVGRLREKTPTTKILILGVFPRGERPNPQREKISDVNSRIAKLADDKQVYYLDIGDKFLSADSSISKEVMPDFLHLSPRGYEIWAEAIELKVAALLNGTSAQ